MMDTARAESPPQEHTPKKELSGSWAAWKAIPRAFPYLKPYKKEAVATVVLLICGALVGLLEPWPLAFLVDSVLDTKTPVPHFIATLFGTNPHVLIAVSALAGLVLSAIGQGISVGNEYVTTNLHQRLTFDLRSDMFRHAQRLSVNYHDRRHTGEFIYWINALAGSIGNATLAFPPLAQATLTLCGMVWITYRLDPLLALIAISIIPFLYQSVTYYSKRVLPNIRHANGQEIKSLSLIHEAISMLRVVVSFGREPYEHRRFRIQGRQAVEARIKVTLQQTLFSLVVETLVAVGTGAVLGLGAYHVLTGRLDLGRLLVVMTYVGAIYSPLQQISSTLGGLNNDVYHLSVCQDLLSWDPEIKEQPDAVDIGRVQGRVEYERVHFSHRGREHTIRGISFQVGPGEKVAVIGPTGAGKSTLMSLLLRFYDPKHGRILVDGHDIRTMKLECLRRQVSVVLQEPLLFSGTIAENIRYGDLNASMAQIVEAAKAANVHDFIMGLPEQYETRLGERGAQLSGGERQRISIARAFVRDAPILVLDEPTSSVDSKTEAAILSALDRLMVGRTTFIISHRLSTIKTASRIIVLNGGVIIERGTHDELMRHQGLYREMFEAQLGELQVYRYSLLEESELGPRIAELARVLLAENELARRRAINELQKTDRRVLLNWASDAIRGGTIEEAHAGAAVAQALGLSDLVVDLLERAACPPASAQPPLMRALRSFSFDPASVEMLLSQVAPERRSEAARLLLGMYGEEIRPHLEELANSGPPGVREAARGAVFGPAEPTGADRSDPVRVDPPEVPRGSPQHQAWMFMRGHPSRPSAKEAARLVGEWLEGEDKSAIAHVLTAVGSPDVAVARQAKEYLSAIWSRLRGMAPGEVRSLLAGLSGRGRPGLTRLVLDHVDSQAVEDRLLALRIGERAPTERCVRAVCSRLQDPVVGVRLSALGLLAQFRVAETIPVLSAALGDPSAPVRMHAVWALSLMDDPRAIPPLVSAFFAEQSMVRDVAGRSIAEWGVDVSLPYLRSRASEESSNSILPLLAYFSRGERDRMTRELGLEGASIADGAGSSDQGSPGEPTDRMLTRRSSRQRRKASGGNQA